MAQDGNRLSAGDNIILDVGPSVPSQAPQGARRGEFSPPPQKETSEQESSKVSQGKNAGKGHQENAVNLEDEEEGMSGEAKEAETVLVNEGAAGRDGDDEATAPGERREGAELGQSQSGATPPSGTASNPNAAPAPPELSLASANIAENAVAAASG